MINSVKIILIRYLLVCATNFHVTNAQYYFNQSRKLNNYRNELHSWEQKSRLITFETLDEDMKVAVEFVVPFLSVPFKKNPDGSPPKSIANINLASLVLTGITVFAGVSTASALTNFARYFSGKRSSDKESKSKKDSTKPLSFGYRSANGEKGEAPISEIISNLEAVFRKYDIDITSCVQKAICVLVRESTVSVSRGRATSTNKVVDGLTSNNWLLRFLSGTAVREAIDAGRSNAECRAKYKYCYWSDYDILEYLSYL